MPQVQSSVDAFAKAVFHAFKYPTQPVFGLLVGKRLQDTTFVTDAVPVMHSLPAVSPHPVLEVAVSAVSSFVKTKGLVVLGLYVANERLDDNNVSPHTSSVVNFLLSSDRVSGSGLVVWQLQNNKLRPTTLFEGSSPILQFQYTSSGAEGSGTSQPISFAKWDSDTCATEAVDENRALVACKTGIVNFEYCKLVDFEDHLENVQLDFFNEKLQIVS